MRNNKKKEKKNINDTRIEWPCQRTESQSK